MFNPLATVNALLDKNTGLTALTILVMFAISMFANFQTQEDVKLLQEDVENLSFGYEYKLISASLHGINDTDDVVEEIRLWQEKGWGAQIAALQVLCEGRGREQLVELIGVTATTDVCRIVN